MKATLNLAVAFYSCGIASAYYDYEQNFVVGPSPISMMIFLFGIFFMYWIIKLLSMEE